MFSYAEIQDGINKATNYVSEGIEQIIAGELDENHSVSPSPGATALATLALYVLGRGFRNNYRLGAYWLRQQYEGGWGKYPGGKPDEEVTRIAEMVIYGTQGGLKTKLGLLRRVRQLSDMVLTLGENVVPGLEGPTPEEILLPAILEDKVLTKLPIYGRPVVVAAAILASDSYDGVWQGVEYLLKNQMADGSWSEDIIATSLAILALMRVGTHFEEAAKGCRWLAQRQYASGGWAAFDQLKTWAVGWAICIFGENFNQKDIPWLDRAVEWLESGQNTDGSYGSTPPYTHPDLDDTAVALIGLHQVKRENPLGISLLKELQNEDGSWGTFPDFKGIPPNISSEFPVYIPSVDVSVHVLEALWRRTRSQDKEIWHGLNWVLSQQDERGAFPASWFEGQIYSTAQVLELLSKWKFNWIRWKSSKQILFARRKSLEYLINSQQDDGGWGSVVETGLTLSALLRYEKIVPKRIFDEGIEYLLRSQKSNGSFEPSYKAIYAKGWNYEEPIATALTAIRALKRYQLVNYP